MLTNLLLFSRFQKLIESKWKIIPLLDRWILFELLPPLFFSIAAFTVVSLSVGVIFDLIRKIVEIGLPFSIAIQILLLKLPSFIVISFPMAMLLSTLLAYGSLNDNSEIKALKSKNIGVLITDHNVRATLAITERSYILNQGEILAYGSSDQLTRNQVVKERYLGNSFD